MFSDVKINLDKHNPDQSVYPGEITFLFYLTHCIALVSRGVVCGPFPCVAISMGVPKRQVNG